MARSIIPLCLVAVALALPTAALPTAVLTPDPEQTAGADIAGLPDPGTALEAAHRVLADAANPVDTLDRTVPAGLPPLDAGCTPAVEVRRTYWTYQVGPWTRQAAQFLQSVQVTWVERVPVAKPAAPSDGVRVEDPGLGLAATPDLSLGGSELGTGIDLAPPVPGPRPPSYREVVHTADVEIAVDAAWRTAPVTWIRHDDRFLVALPAGLPLVASGEGRLVPACEGDTVLALPPALRTSPAYPWGLHPSARRALVVEDVTAAVATPDQVAQLPRACLADGTPCPSEVLAAVEDVVDGLRLGWPDAEAQRDAVRRAAHPRTATPPAGDANEGAAAGWLQQTASSPAAYAAVGLLALAGLAAAGRHAARRRT